MIKEFLKHIWPSQGFYCIASPEKNGKGGFYYKQSLFTDIEEATKKAEAIDAEGKDCYMAVGTLKERSVLDEKTGKKQVRVHENIGWFKSLIFDIDCGKGKPYETQKDALVHLKEFCKETSLPIPTVVNSGGGIHVYFTFDRDAEAEEWHDLALKLKAVARDFGLDVDNSRTSDKSSVLRVAGTHNHKRGLKRPVGVISLGEPTRPEQLIARLNGIVESKNLKIEKPRKFDPNKKSKFQISNSLKGAFGNVKSNIWEKYDGELIFSRCNVMGKCLEFGGDVPEPVWYVSLQADRHHENPRPLDLSTGYSGYNEGEMNAKLDQLERKDVGYTTCATFQEKIAGETKHDCSTWCDGCKYKGKIRSPRELGASLAKLAPPNTPENVVVTNEVVEEVVEEQSEEFDATSAFGGTEVIMQDFGVPDEPETSKPEIPEPEAPVTNAESAKAGISHAPETLETDFGFDISFPDAPYPYTRNPGGLFMSIEDEETGLFDETLILDYDIFPKEIRAEKIGGNFTVIMEARLPNETAGRLFELPWSQVVEEKALIKVLADTGVVCDNKRLFDMLKDYMTKYIKEIQRLVKTVQKYSQLGWHDDGDLFVLPEQTLLKDGTKEKSGVNKGLTHSVKSFRKKGTLENWRKIIDVYSRPGYEPYAFGHLAGYGSLLFRFTDYEGAIVSLVGRSGSGKSTVLKTINSIFGHPVEPMLVQTDTYLARMNRLGVFKSICVTYDEITNIHDDELSDLCYSITQGRGKHRLNQNAEAKENTTTWQMLLVSSSNDPSLLSKLGNLKHDASAESLRVFEYRIDPDHRMTKEESKIFDTLKHNFGHAGEIFVNYVIQHPEEVQRIVSDYQIRFDEIANVPITERYWSVIVSCTLAGGFIANKLGLSDFDMEKLFHWAVSQVSIMRNIVIDNRTDPVDSLNAYLGQNQMAMMVVSDSKVTKNGIFVEREPRTSLLIRADITNQKAYINRTALKNWVTKGGGDYHSMKTSLKQSKILLNADKNMTLSAGTKLFPSGQVRCWLIDLDHPMMTGAMRTVTDVTNSAEIIKMDGVDKDETG